MFKRALAVGAVAMAVSSSAFAENHMSYGGPPNGGAFYQPSPWAFRVEIGLGVQANSETAGVLEVEAAAARPIGSGPWNVELEGYGLGLFEDGHSSALVGAYVHAFHKGPQAALGGFAGIGTGFGWPVFVFGVEGNAYFNQFVLKGQAAYNVSLNSSMDGFVSLRGGLDYYFTEDHLFGGYLAFNGANGFNTTEFGLRAERRVLDHLSLFGSVAAITGSGDTAWRFMGGVKAFSGNSLRDNAERVPFGVSYIPYNMNKY